MLNVILKIYTIEAILRNKFSLYHYFLTKVMERGTYLREALFCFIFWQNGMDVNWGEGMDTYLRKYGIIWGSRVQSLP